ncbi:MAG: CoA-acylating methylmalonate-semialdehyde dehydrogenase [Bacteroidia bacterium]|nr:CoA-acylating methylmalonate-semialdehyde dehydrogenase [Bacteroidia bacterium]
MTEQIIDIPVVKHWIGGCWVENTGNTMPVDSPIDGSYLGEMPVGGSLEVEKAVLAAAKAFPSWSQTPIKERVQVLYRYRTLLEKYRLELGHLVQKENGKTLDESLAEVDKAIELTEFACSMPQLAYGELLEVSAGVECRVERFPLGVVASIVPFNFPLMVPNWTIPNAIALGNCMILKPSEQVPLTSIRIAELLQEAGLPEGVFNLVQGGQAVVEAICDHPGIKAISFVGSTKVAKIVYKRATANLKNCLALGGAKNHLIVLPDADIQMTASNVIASMSGCAGQRCMAAATVLAVANIENIIAEMCNEAKKIIPGKNLGAVISKTAKERIEGYITEAEQQGAKILVDGRNHVVQGKENGYYVGPTVIDYVTPDMKIAQEEIFGPVICIIRTPDMDTAIAIQHNSLYGNASSIFTRSGGAAKYFQQNANAGMIGVNIGVPVPREPFSFGGWNESKFGTGDITGKSSIEFWTKLKKTTTKWEASAKTNWMS